MIICHREHTTAHSASQRNVTAVLNLSVKAWWAAQAALPLNGLNIMLLTSPNDCKVSVTADLSLLTMVLVIDSRCQIIS